MNYSRCFDCFTDIGRDAKRFAVLKKMRDVDPDQQGSVEGMAYLMAMCFDPVCLCEDCAGWYGDEAIEITEHGSFS